MIHYLSSNIQGHVVVLSMGWDPTQQQFFMNVTKDSQSGELFYSNVMDGNAWEGSLKYYLRLLREWGLMIPDNMLAALRHDQRTNHITTWDKSGNRL